MKSITITSILTFTILFCFGQIPGEDNRKKNIAKNRIQLQVQWNHKYEKGKPKRNGYKNYTKKFDHNGNVIEEIYYQSGSIDQKLSYKYDQNENKIEYVNYEGNENKILFKQNITYDNSMKKIREERYDGTDYQIIKYNYSNNKLSEIIRSDIYGNIEHKRVFNYTDNICTISILDEKSIKVGKIINKYDKQDNIIESTEYDPNGKVKEKYYYTFEKNLVKGKTKYVSENFMYKEEYEYDSKGNLVKVFKEEPKGNVFVNNMYKYDNKGNLIEEQWYDNNPNEYSKKTYIYSSKNILEKVEVYYALYRYRIQYKYKYTYF